MEGFDVIDDTETQPTSRGWPTSDHDWRCYRARLDRLRRCRNQRTSRAVASLHGTAMAVGSVVVGLVAPYVVRRIGRGGMMRLGSVLVAVGLALYVTGGALPLTLLGILVAAGGGTFCLVGANAFMPDHQGPATPQAMSEMHAFGAVMGLLGPLAVGAGVALAWGWRPALVAAAVAFVVLEVVRGRRLHDYDGRFGTEGAVHAPRERMTSPFWIAIAAWSAKARSTPSCIELRVPGGLAGEEAIATPSVDQEGPEREPPTQPSLQSRQGCRHVARGNDLPDTEVSSLTQHLAE